MRFISARPCTDWGQCDNKTSYMHTKKKSLHTFLENKKERPHLNAMSNAQLNCQSFSHKNYPKKKKTKNLKDKPQKTL